MLVVPRLPDELLLQCLQLPVLLLPQLLLVLGLLLGLLEPVSEALERGGEKEGIGKMKREDRDPSPGNDLTNIPRRPQAM